MSLGSNEKSPIGLTYGRWTVLAVVGKIPPWREANPEVRAASARRTRYRITYGIELEDAERMLDAQDGACAICRDSVILRGKAGAKLDHDHATGQVRGVLCSRCNTALGSFRDNTTILLAAVKYLEASRLPVAAK